jgi:hypothetical protein
VIRGFGEFVGFWLANEPSNDARPEETWHPDPHNDSHQTECPVR